MPNTKKKTNDVKAVVLLDACMECLDRCRSGCDDDVNIKCIHRFNGKVRVIACNGFASFMRLSDSQVVLYFLWPLMRSEFSKILSRDCRYFIVTRDKTFKHQVQKEWERKKNGKTVPVMFFGDNEIKVWFKNRKGKTKDAELKEIIIEIVTVQGTQVAGGCHEEPAMVIDYVNKLVFGK